MIKKLLEREVKDRLGTLKDGVEDVKTHPWFSSIDLEQFSAKQLPAPWVPPIKSSTDTSLFDGYEQEDHVDNTSIDIGGN